MSRVTDWEVELAKAVESRRELPFEWGAHDCCRFAAACVDAITGGDYLERLSTKYTDERSAKAYIGSSGGIRAAVSSFLGDPVESWAAARRGDVCLVPTEEGEGLGVCTGAVIVVAGPVGFGFYHLERALAVWRVD